VSDRNNSFFRPFGRTFWGGEGGFWGPWWASKRAVGGLPGARLGGGGRARLGGGRPRIGVFSPPQSYMTEGGPKPHYISIYMRAQNGPDSQKPGNSSGIAIFDDFEKTSKKYPFRGLKTPLKTGILKKTRFFLIDFGISRSTQCDTAHQKKWLWGGGGGSNMGTSTHEGFSLYGAKYMTKISGYFWNFWKFSQNFEKKWNKCLKKRTFGSYISSKPNKSDFGQFLGFQGFSGTPQKPKSDRISVFSLFFGFLVKSAIFRDFTDFGHFQGCGRALFRPFWGLPGAILRPPQRPFWGLKSAIPGFLKPCLALFDP